MGQLVDALQQDYYSICSLCVLPMCMGCSQRSPIFIPNSKALKGSCMDLLCLNGGLVDI